MGQKFQGRSKEFGSAFTRLQKDARKVASESDRTSQNLDNYFKQFNREIVAERDSAQRASARDTEQSQRLNYDAYAEMLRNGKKNYMELVGNLTDIQTKLAGGINAESIKAVNPLFSRATDNALSTKGAVTSITDAINKAIAGR